MQRVDERQKGVVFNGDEAVAFAVKQSDVDVVAAYPITPQTIMVEKLAEYKANGEADFEFIPVESEHSAMSVVLGAAAFGARTFTATASQGLLLMNEVLWIVSSLRLPVVMGVANRAVSAPINIHCDHTDMMAARDTSWIIINAENAQEAYDSTIQAFKIAEDKRVLLPVMITFDGFFVSHKAETIKVFGRDDDVLEFIGGPRKPPEIEVRGEKVEFSLNPKNKIPLTFGPLDLYDYYFEHKVQQSLAMERSYDVIREVNEAWGRFSGRSYGDGLLQTYNTDDAEIVLVVMGSTAGTLRYVLNEFKKNDERIGLVRIRTFRPFPYKELADVIKDARVVGVFDRSQDIGAQGGPLYVETRAALYDLDERPSVVNFVYGLGGRDAPPKLLKQAIDRLIAIKNGKERPFRRLYLGVRGPEIRGE